MQIEDKPEGDNEERAEPPRAPSTSIRRRIAVKSDPRADTTQEAVDVYREKAMRIASVEQIELGSIVSCQSRVRFSGGQETIQSFWRSIVVQSGWMEHEE